MKKKKQFKWQTGCWFVIIPLFLVFTPMNSSAQSLLDYKWKNRLIFLVGHTTKSIELQDQLALFMNEKEAMVERDLLLFIVNDTDIATPEKSSSISVTELRKIAHINADFEGVVLIGKDGGYKLKKGFPVEPATVFDLIDGMPMRQFEKNNR